MARSRACIVVLALILMSAVSCTSGPGGAPATTLGASNPPKPTISPSASAAPAPKAQRTTSVGVLQLVSASFGVATVYRCHGDRCRDRLHATEDFGRTWSDITPSQVPNGSSIDSVFFLDRLHGWVVADDCVGGKATLFRTEDGARTWRRTAIEGASCNAGANVSPSFVDSWNGWLIHQEPTGSSASLQRTTDGGKTWSRARDFEWITSIRFLDPLDGWYGGFLHDRGGLFRTQDGGRTWARVPTPLPDCCDGWQAYYDRPTFSDLYHAVVPITLRNGHREVVAFDATADGGRTWRLASVFRPRGAGPDSAFPAPRPVGIASPTDWWTVARGSPAVFHTDDGGNTWQRSRIAGEGRVVSIAAIDARRAWAIAYLDRQRSLFVTRDGGRSWRAVTPVTSAGSPAASQEIRKVLPLPGPVTALTAGEDGTLYAAYLLHSNGDRQVIVRFDPATGSVVRSVPIAGGQGGVHRLAYAGGSLWASGGTRFRGSDRLLYRLDGNTLAVRDRLTMSAPPIALAAVPAGLWVAVGKRLVLLDPWSGAVRGTVPFAGRVRLLVADPSGEDLYVATDAPVRHDRTPLLQLDAETGTTIASSWQGFADLAGPSGLAATDEGVWVTTPTGMMATLSLLREGDLRQAAVFEPGRSNGLSAYVAGGVLWVTHASGGYYCADAFDGPVLGHVETEGTEYGVSDVVAVPSGLYVGGWKTLERIVPGPTCRAD